jgi:GH25 family lysozyme M1 (1,4-beta-N-acetylmuramidase)
MTRALLLLAVLAPACMDDTVTLSETAQEAGSLCADGPTTYGIDVSRFQGDINWQLVAGSGVKFAYIQISRSLTDIDAKFAYNWQNAKANGILRGAYQRFHPAQDVIGQAKLFLDKLGPFQVGDLPPMLDVEDADGLTAAQIAAAVKQWMNYIEPRVGVKPLIYTGFYFWRDSVGSANFSEHPLWIANYGATCPLVPDRWTRWAFHQYSSTAMVPGITANTCDVNKFNGTLADLKALSAKPECGDETCNGDETVDSCDMDCKPCQVISDVGDAIVDDASACFSAGGDPKFIREANAGYGSKLKWTYTTDLAAAESFGRWELYFANPGTYRVEAFTPAPYNGSKQAVYKVHHMGTISDAPVDQSAVDGWNVLGEFEFEAGGHGQFIRVDDNTGEPGSADTQIVFDALRFTLVTKDDGQPDEEEPPAGDDAGCTATRDSSQSSLVWLGLAGLLLRRRRCTDSLLTPR